MNRNMNWPAAFAIVGASMLVLMGNAPKNDVIEAKRIVIKDDQGNVKAFMDAPGGHGRIWLYDEGNKSRVFLGGARSGPGLTVNNESGQARIKVLDEPNGAYVSLHDSSGKELFKKP